MLKLISETPF